MKNIMTEFEEYVQTQKHKFVPQQTIKAMKFRERSIDYKKPNRSVTAQRFSSTLEVRKFHQRKSSKKTSIKRKERTNKSIDVYINKANKGHKKILRRRAMRTKHVSGAGSKSKSKTPYIKGSLLEMPPIDVKPKSSANKGRRILYQSVNNSQDQGMLNPITSKKSHKLSNIYSYDTQPATQNRNSQKSKTQKGKLFHIHDNKISCGNYCFENIEIKKLVNSGTYNSDRYILPQTQDSRDRK